MYKKFFGLRDNPFNIVPDPRYLLSTAETDEAFANLIFGVQSHKGLVLLTGEVGTGKTILLKKLVDRLQRESAATAFIFNPRLNPTEFFDYMLSDFGVAHDPHDKPRMLRTLYQWLQDRHRLSQTTVLIVDEAHDLAPEVFEEVRLLSNLETPTDKLLQIVLSGQPEIEEKLSLPEMRLFRQRIALRRRIHALTLEDTKKYIAHRLRVGGGDPAQIFSPEAMASAFEASHGIPRVINLVCEQALISAYADQEKPVRAATVEDAAAQFQLNSGASPLSLPSNATAEDVESATQSLLEMVAPNPSPKSSGAPVASPPPAGSPIARDKHPTVEAAKNPAPRQVETPSPIPAKESSGLQVSSAKSEKLAEDVAPSAAGSIGPTARPQPKPMEHPRQTPAPVTKPSAPHAQFPAGIPVRAPAREPVSARAAVTPESKPERTGRPPLPPISHRARPEVSNTTVPASKTPAGRVPATVPDAGPAGEHHPVSDKPAPAAPPAPPIRPLLPKRERNYTPLFWAIYVILAVTAALGGYYFAAKNPDALKSVWGNAPTPSQPAKAAKGTKPISRMAKLRAAPKESNQDPATGQPVNGVSDQVAGQEGTTPSAAAEKDKLPPVSDTSPERLRAQASPRANAQKRFAALPAQPPGQILVTSNVAGAAIKLDGESNPAWVTPHTFANLAPGSHSLILSEPGYSDVAQSVNVESGRVMIVTATMVALGGELIITTEPPGAEVSIDGRSFGPSPVRTRVVTGRHSYTAKLAGRATAEGTVNVADQGVVARSVELPPAMLPAAEMNVQVSTNPPNATVFADGTPKGETPTSFHMSPGHHTLILSASGFQPLQREIEVPESGVVTINETLAGR